MMYFIMGFIYATKKLQKIILKKDLGFIGPWSGPEPKAAFVLCAVFTVVCPFNISCDFESFKI